MKDNSILASIIINGDISKLSRQEKLTYYHSFCDRLGLDPLAQPFKLLKLNGREILYCDRTGAQQLNKLHRVSHEIRARETVSGCYVVTAQAYTPDGRRTESIGAVPVESLRGDTLCNAMMKAETKAKRRATLDLLGLGILDETELEGMVHTGGQPLAQEEEPTAATIDPFTTTYEDAAALLHALAQVTRVAQLGALYNANAALVDRNPKVREAFGETKSKLKSENQKRAS